MNNNFEKIKSIDLRILPVIFFLVFFIFTPLLLKLKFFTDVYIEPLIPILFLSVTTLAVIYILKKDNKPVWESLKYYFFRNKILTFYFLLLAVLSISFIYGFFLTGIFSTFDLLKLIKFSLYALVFPISIYTATLLNREQIKKILLVFAFVGVFTALFTLIRIISNIETGGLNDFWQYSPDAKAVGFLGQYFDPLNLSFGQISKGANGTYGLFLSIILCIFLVFITTTKSFTKWWYLYLVGIVITFGAVLYTLSRSTFLTIAFIFAAWLFYLTKNKLVTLATFSIILLLIVETGVLSAVNPQLYAKISSSVAISETKGGGGGSGTGSVDVKIDSSSYGRVEQWKATFETFGKYPVFVVTGIGYSRENLDKYVEGNLSSSHSLFLDMWVRGSIAALAIMIALWFLIFKTTIGFWNSKDQFVKIFGVVLFGFLIGWLIDNLISGEQFFSDAVMLAFWGTFGFIYALNSKKVKSAKISKKS